MMRLKVPSARVSSIPEVITESELAPAGVYVFSRSRNFELPPDPEQE